MLEELIYNLVTECLIGNKAIIGYQAVVYTGWYNSFSTFQ